MVFNSFVFVIFFAVVLFVHALPLPWTVKKLNLLVLSAVFYGAYRPAFLALLAASAIVDFHLARAIARETRPAARTAWVIASVALNLSVLGYFKYGGSAALPLGISFYTFESISYIVDVYRRRVEPARSFLDYALFLSFFPHLVAGPIVRAGAMLPQFYERRGVSSAQRGWGLSLIVLGLFQKIVLADAILAPVVDRAFLDVSNTTFVDAWIGAFCFSGQIFCDFSGYSSCAIGAALCLGFALGDNFRQPLAARSVSDFWRRWHISLSNWFRDYVYIPLGGNRAGPTRTVLNLLVTFALCGLWHGAGWGFVVWGALHGALVAFERLRPPVRGWLALLRLHVLLAVAWVFFRAADVTSALTLLARMLHPSRAATQTSGGALACAAAIMAGLIGCHLLLRDTSLEAVVARTSWPTRAGVLTVLLLAIVLTPGEDRAFIYFQF